MIHTLGLPRKVVHRLFENALSTNMSEDEIIQLFGAKKHFTFADAEHVNTMPAPLQEFGPTKISQKARKAVFDSLPDGFKGLIPGHYHTHQGTFEDKEGRRYKREETVDGIGTRWTVLIPKGKREDLEFPVVGDNIIFKQDSATHNYLVTDILPAYQNSAIILMIHAKE